MKHVPAKFAYLIFLIGIVLLFPVFLSGDVQPSFTRLTLADGLSHSRIYALLQDSRGFLWIGTSNGLNRYDGRDFLVFKHSPSDDTSLPHNYVTNLMEDHQGYIWVATDGGGLARMDPYTHDFLRYSAEENDDKRKIDDNFIWGLFEDSQGQIWIGSRYAGIHIISKDRLQIRNIRKGHPGFGLSDNNVWPILEDVNGDVWIGTDGGGLTRWVQQTGNFIHYRHDPEIDGSLSSDHIFSLYIDSHQTLWVGTVQGGLNRFDRATQSFQSYEHEPGSSDTLSHNTVRAIYEDSSGRFWVGTTDGLNLFDKDSETFVQIYHDPANDYSLSHSRIHVIMEDSSGVLWFGSRDGLNKSIKSNFRTVYLQGQPEDIPRRNDIRSVQEMESGEFLIGSFQGLFLYADDQQEELLPSQIIYDIYLHDDGQIFFGSNIGFHSLNKNDFGRWEVKELFPGIINKIIHDGNNRLWVATERSGLALYDIETQEQTWYTPEDSSIIRLPSWSVADLLMAHNKQLFISFQNYPLMTIDWESLNLNFVRDDLFEDIPAYYMRHSRNGLYYFGIDQQGILEIDVGKNTRRLITEKDGLPSDYLRGVVAESEYIVWFSTLRGLARYDRRDLSINRFGIEDGLPALIFNPASAMLTRNGDIYFGSTSGLVKVDLEAPSERRYSPQMALEVFSSITSQENLYKAGKELVLPADSRLIVIKLTAFDFTYPSRLNYAYRFSDRDAWVEVGSHGQIVFSHLAPGSYEIQLRASNSDGIWMEEPKILDLTIEQPFVLRWYMLLVYAGMVGMLVIVMLRVRSMKHLQVIQYQEELVHQRTLELERAKDALEEEIRKKSMFFVNLAHETKTPLTFIQNYLERYIMRHGEDEDLRHVKENIDKLVRDMLNYLDAEKLNKSESVYNHSQISYFTELIESKRSLITAAAKKRSLTVEFRIKDNVFLQADPLALDRVLNNLIDNAMKYNKDGGEILVSLDMDGEAAVFTVADTGVGIDTEMLDKIFDPYFQCSFPKNNVQGIGMGLAIVKKILQTMGATILIDSDPEKGSQFIVRFFNVAGTELHKNVKQREFSVSSSFSILPQSIPVHTQWQLDKKTILLVDDDNNMLHLLKEYLKDKYNLLFYNSAETVLSELQNIPEPDLIISDVMLNGMDGHSLLARLQETDWCSVAFIFLSAKAERENLLQGIYEGAVDFIAKPFKIEHLLERVDARMRGQARRREMLFRSVQQQIQESFAGARSKNLATGQHNHDHSELQKISEALELTKREEEIFSLICQGKINKEIGDELNISVRTVERHVYNLFKKAKVQNRIELLNLVNSK